EKNKINRKLKNQKRQLEEANAVKDKLFSIIAHDLRTPLSALTGILELVREPTLSEEEMRELFSEMEFSLQQNMNVMENLLAWANQQMSGLNMEIRTINATEIVDEIMESLKFNARHKQITLENELSPDLEVQGDYNLFKLVVRNLISNSIKFSNSGDHITIDATKENGEVHFEIRDTGIGIPEDMQDKIFAGGMHSRKGTREEKGSGLGLNLCKEFVEKQGGRIYFESTEGKGTVFYFTLPISDEKESDSNKFAHINSEDAV
ncbi:MAG: sensor histidine kinase, partial [Candidatus Cyclobacteriaceae bacterium M2_1C_046]